MQLHPINTRSAPYQIRALSMVGNAAEGGFGAAQRALFDAIINVVFGVHESLTDLQEISAKDLATHIECSDQALQLIRMMVVICLADGLPRPEQVSLVADFAKALGVDEPSVKIVGYLAKRQLLRFRLAFLRRSHMRHYLRNTYRMSGGILPVLKALLRFRGILGEDAKTVSRFKSLESLAKETLGNQFFYHCVGAGIAFPGEKGGFPEGAIYHDVTHVLNGYDTSAQGELKNAAFQAGYTKDGHDFFTWLLAMVLHGARVNLTPFPMPNIEGLLAEEGLAECMVREISLGSAAKVDLGRAWNFWDFAEMPIDEARTLLGFPSRSFRRARAASV
jgi:hypothetical protein